MGGQQYLTIDIDRGAIARYGLNAADVNDVIETAIAGKSATEIYEGERRFCRRGASAARICATAWKTFANCRSALRMDRAFR